VWWWVPVGLAAWLGVSLGVGLLVGRFLRNAAQARDAQDAQAQKKLAERQEPPQDGPRVALWGSKRDGAGASGRVLRGAGLPVGPIPAAARAEAGSSGSRSGIRGRSAGAGVGTLRSPINSCAGASAWRPGQGVQVRARRPGADHDQS